MSGLTDLLRTASVVLCCGTGGVGKTTTAAALALAAAEDGRRVVVVTIDPARRLADALGLEAIGNECVPVDLDVAGELWVTMLDTKATFDGLIERHAIDNAQAQRILENRYYRNLSTSLSGTREFMAMERLHELNDESRFDVVVVDTPPSRNALDFLEAPDRLARFLDGRLFRLAAPGRGVTRKVAAPALMLLRRIARVISPEVVDDTLAFIEAFSGMEEGFKERATAVDELLGAATTAFVLVASPTAEAVDESGFFVSKLSTAGIEVDALVLNRCQPRFTERDWGALGRDERLPAGALAQLDALRELTELADSEDEQSRVLVERCAAAVVARVQELDHDVHDLAGIAEVAAKLRG